MFTIEPGVGSGESRAARGRCVGFTLIQVVIVMAIMALIAAVTLSALGTGSKVSGRAVCDVRLKQIALALEAYRQDNGRSPQDLSELTGNNYLKDASMLRCPDDPDPMSNGYDDFYIIREPRDTGELPVVVCPFHDSGGNQGLQAFKGRYTTQFKAYPAQLEAAVDTTLQVSGQAPMSAASGMSLHGGDVVATGTTGSAVIRFSDGDLSGPGSSVQLTSNSTMRILESFNQGQPSHTFFTLVKQKLGTAFYTVHHGSKFDVTTPIATAGALGTKFQLDVAAYSGGTVLTVTEGTVAFTSATETVEAPTGYHNTVNHGKHKGRSK